MARAGFCRKQTARCSLRRTDGACVPPPLVVEISVAFSILIAFIVIGIFLFRIRERFDTVDVGALDRFRGDRA